MLLNSKSLCLGGFYRHFYSAHEKDKEKYILNTFSNVCVISVCFHPAGKGDRFLKDTQQGVAIQ